MSERDEILPTPERYSHSVIERDERNQDDSGNVSRPHRTIDILGALHRGGKITGEMRQAGYDFRNLFDRANLDPLQCSDVSRPMVSGRARNSNILSRRIEDARTDVHAAVAALGGPASDSGNCVYKVIGEGYSIKAWAEEYSRLYRPVSQHEASGVLRGALGVLVKHFESR